MTSNPHWYLIQCKPREDSRALEHLERQQFSCYLPLLKVEELRNHRKVEAGEPLFPGYLFIHLDKVHDNWHLIRSTRGVARIVRFSDDPVPVPDAVIHSIRERTRTDQPPVPLFTPGERVRVTEGCFANLEAIFVANDGDERVMLLMNILQQEQMLSFPVGDVRNHEVPTRAQSVIRDAEHYRT